MPERLQNLSNELLAFFTKIIVPAIIGVGIKIAVEMQRENKKISYINVLLSIIIAVGIVYAFSAVVYKHIEEIYVPGVLSLIAMLSKDIAGFIIYKFNVDIFLTSLVNVAQDSIVNFFKRK